MIAPSLSGSCSLTCSGNLAGELERDGVRGANGNRTGAFVAGEAEPPRETAGRRAFASLVNCGAEIVMLNARGCAVLASSSCMGDGELTPNDCKGPLDGVGGEVGEAPKGVKDWEWLWELSCDGVISDSSW